MLLAYAFALESPQVVAETIEASAFMDLARAHRVLGVPRTIVNGTQGIDGALPEREFLDAVLDAAASPPAGAPPPP